jgi:exodeoxyribonuclease VII small subunit
LTGARAALIAARMTDPRPDVSELSFEAALRRLEEIVRKLESGEAPLDEALLLWQQGEELYRFCRARLDSAEGKIEELANRAEAAKP